MESVLVIGLRVAASGGMLAWTEMLPAEVYLFLCCSGCGFWVHACVEFARS